MKPRRWLLALSALMGAGAILLTMNLGYACACKRKTTGYFQQIGLPPAATTNNVRPGIAQSLTGGRGDPQAGRAVIVNRKKGNCLACHRIGLLSDAPYHGDVGPSLDGVARRYTEAQLRQLIVDARAYFPNTPMPAFYAKEGMHRVLDKFKGKTILTAQEVEDVIAFLLQLN